MFKKFFESRARNLLDLYEATSDVSHPGEKGMLRELVLARLFESLLPPQFGIGTGVVVDKWGRQSKQIDLIIYDRRKIPPIFVDQGRGIFPVDSVLRVIEVKSRLDQDGLESAFRSFRLFDPGNPEGLKLAAKGTLPDGKSVYPVTSLFAYDSTISDFSSARSKIELEKVESFRFLCVVAKSLVIFGDRLKPEMLGSSQEQAIRRFVSLVAQFLEEDGESRHSFSPIEWLLD